MQQLFMVFWSFVLMALPALAILAAIRKARGTTLTAPLAWALSAYVVLNLTGLFLSPGPTLDNWIYIAATATLCPTVALFGAKRPQNRAWQFIVFSFWFVTALPAIQFLLLRPGETLDLHGVWKWFLLILILIGGINYLPTRFAWASLLVTLGQALLLWYYLPGVSPSLMIVDPAVGVAAIMLGIGLAYWAGRRTSQRLAPYRGWNRAWRDFRDFYGAVWALRIMERVNSLSQALDAGVRLYWDGFYEVRPATGYHNCNTVAADGKPPDDAAPMPDSIEIQPASPDVVAPLDAALRNLLRRFVSNDWIDSRLQTDSITTK